MTWRVFDRQRHRGAGYSSLAFLDNARPRNLNASAHCGAVAQMGERCNRTAEVRGSIPLGSTTSPKTALPKSRYPSRCTQVGWIEDGSIEVDGSEIFPD